MTVLSATLKLMPSPAARVLAVIGFDDVFAAADAVPEVLQYGPIGARRHRRSAGRVHPREASARGRPATCCREGKGWLVAEFGADSDRGRRREPRQASSDDFEQQGPRRRTAARQAQQAEDLGGARRRRSARRRTCPACRRPIPAGRTAPCAREDLGDYLRELKALFHKHGYEASVYGHFGDGLVHCRVDFDLRTEAGLSDWRHFLDEAADLVVRYGGSLSGEHGDGQARAALLEKMYGPELVAGLPRVQGDLGPARADEPGQGGRSLSDHLQPARRPDLPAAGGQAATSPIRRTAAASPRRRGAASASAPAAAATATRA